jgi:hypothetical protein
MSTSQFYPEGWWLWGCSEGDFALITALYQEVRTYRGTDERSKRKKMKKRKWQSLGSAVQGTVL